MTEVNEIDKERLKMMMTKVRKKKIEFIRPWSFKLKRLGESWRKPKGKDDKYRLQKKGYGSIVKIGYRSPKIIRGLHPSGYIEKVIHRPEDLEDLDPQKHAVKIAHTVGMKKRLEIMKKAKELKIKILNPIPIEET
ncbi:MAG: 50S ribosomal protein L32e [Candidatus Methanomethylicia archaeon]|nr:50S ribosomal protein L32e [Candidatus Methanomethylicia archaeon]MCX8168958.1 50S ribosomal protein L32e [Candidatus Methanomethylicia archaeon]MDW7988690.1 50S ribosomal protein L32e [Nitrososphaerota archaeon]